MDNGNISKACASVLPLHSTTHLQDPNVPLADFVVDADVIELHVHPEHCRKRANVTTFTGHSGRNTQKKTVIH